MSGQAIITIKNKEWLVDVAVLPSELSQGLGGIPEIIAGTGMLFDMGYEQTINVTTVPMLFPLDIAFLSDELVITGVYQNVNPGYLVTSQLLTRYFIEVNAGELHDITSGDQVVVELLPVEEVLVAPNPIAMMFGMTGFLLLGLLVVSMASETVEQLEKNPEFVPQVSLRKSESSYELETDRMGNIIITRTDEPGNDIFLQFESDKDLVYDLLKKNEKKDLNAGWKVRIKRTEPRASILNEFWDNSACRQPSPETLRKPVSGDCLNFLPDSPEFLAYTLDDIGYREKIDTAFLSAIARSRRKAS